MDELFITLSRWQFAATALYHFLFVPLTLGLSFLLVAMETTYVVTGKQIYKDMTLFWGKLFGINFALGVTTGLTMEFQFGTNWAYYSHYVGDIFGAPLAIEGLIAFFLESTFVGLFFLGWDRLSKKAHLVTVWCVAIGSNFSALWILVANGWMQNPAGSEFNFETMRMEMTSFAEVVLNPIAQSKFLHTVSGGYIAGSMFVLAISSWYIMKGRDIEFAKRSIVIATTFGTLAAMSSIIVGDDAGHEWKEFQPMKLAAVEAEWETHPAPAAFNLVGFPSMADKDNHFMLEIPAVMGLITTRSLDTEVLGIKDMVKINEERIRNGIVANDLLAQLRELRLENRKLRKAGQPEVEIPADLREAFDKVKGDLGYGLLLKEFVDNPIDATDEQIKKAAWNTVPHVPTLFWTFRIMVGIGFFALFLFATGLYLVSTNKAHTNKLFLKVAFLSFGLPWIAIEFGWYVAELGRQPWAIDGVLPTFLAASSLTVRDLILSLAGFVGLYTILLIAEIYLMVHFAKKGPSSLHTGRYADEKGAGAGTITGAADSVNKGE